MSERVVLRILIGLSVALIFSELVLLIIFGVRIEMILLPFVVFLAAVGVLLGIAFLKGMRPEIESVSMRRARAMKDDMIRKRLEGYEVDEEFMPGGRKKRQKGRASALQPPFSHEAKPFTPPASTSRGVESDPFAGLEPKVLGLIESFGGVTQMVQKIESMDQVSYKRMLYGLKMPVVEKEEFLQPVRQAMGGSCRSKGSLRTDLDHEGMDDYIKKVLAGRDRSSESSSDTYSLDIDPGSFSTGSSSPPSEFSHKPEAVLDQFKRSLKRK